MKSRKSVVNKRDNIFHKYDTYCCPFCSSLPEILNFNEGNSIIKLKCKKHGENSIDIQEYLDKMMTWERTSEIKLKNKCSIHNDQYSYYCQNCEENICIKCLKESDKHLNHIKYDINSLRPNNTEIELIKEKINICLQTKDELIRRIKNLDNKITFYDTLINSYEKQSTNYLLTINIKHLLHGEKLNFDSIKNDEFVKIQSKKEMFEDFIKNNFLKATEGLNQLNLKNKKTGNDLLEQLFKGLEDTTIFKILKFCGQIQGPKEVSSMVNFKYINLRGNNISSLNFISGRRFPALEILSLNCNEINSIESLKTVSFPLLSELYLSKNNISNIDILSDLNIKKLKILWLSNNNISSIDVFEKVKFPELVKLGLNKNNINDIGVFQKGKAKFPRLFELYLNDNIFNKDKFLEILIELYKRIPEFYC